MSSMPAMVAAARRHLLAHFRCQAALSEGSAVPYEGSGPLERRQFERMRRAGVLRRARSGRYWLDEARAAEWNMQRRKRGLRVAGAVLAAGAIALLLSPR